MALEFEDLPVEVQEFVPDIQRRTVNLTDARVLSLRSLESKRTRVKGSGYCLSDADRRKHGGTSYLLIAEPDNVMDSKAVAVYSTKGLRVGYLSAAAAGRFYPVLQQLGADALKVAGAGTTRNSIVLWVDLPLTAPLRDFVKSRSAT